MKGHKRKRSKMNDESIIKSSILLVGKQDSWLVNIRTLSFLDTDIKKLYLTFQHRYDGLNLETVAINIFETINSFR